MQFCSLRGLVASAVIVVAGCATIPSDRGESDVRDQLTGRGLVWTGADDADRAALITELLAKPLTADAAVHVAFINNPLMQMEYARLGMSGADVIQAGRLDNPTLSAGWQTSSRSSDASRYDFGLTQNFAQLLLLNAHTRFSKGEFERAKLDSIQRLLDLAARVQRAYYDVVGTRQIVQMRTTVATAASAAAELTARFNAAGNINALELAIAQTAASEALLDQERAVADAADVAIVLNELMGLDADSHWEIGLALPVPVIAEDPLDVLQQLAMAQRADLDSERRAVVLLEDALGVARSYRYLGAVEVGAQYERDTDRNRLLGPSLSLQLPIFNQGQAAVLRAESLLDAARARAHAKEIEVGNGVKAANTRVLATRQRVDRLANETIPLREKIVERTQEQANYMLVGVFDLLRAKQDEYATYQQYLEAVRDYWQARVDLAHAVGARLPSDRLIGAAVVVPRLPVEPAAGGADHSNHHIPVSDAAPAAAAVFSTSPDHDHHGE